MLRLYLLRHAKSSWSDPSLHDFDRPLNKRGQRDAPRMGAWMRKNGHQPERILCSSSMRTKQTLGGILTGLDGEFSLALLDDLYEGNAPDYLLLLRDHAEGSNNVMIIGHNTGLQEIALRLAGKGESGQIADMEYKYPTSALAILDFPVNSWNDVTAASGQLVDFIKPREIDDLSDRSLLENPAPTFFRR